jgi:hypothetical protein
MGEKNKKKQKLKLNIFQYFKNKKKIKNFKILKKFQNEKFFKKFQKISVFIKFKIFKF